MKNNTRKIKEKRLNNITRKRNTKTNIKSHMCNETLTVKEPIHQNDINKNIESIDDVASVKPSDRLHFMFVIEKEQTDRINEIKSAFQQIKGKYQNVDLELLEVEDLSLDETIINYNDYEIMKQQKVIQYLSEHPNYVSDSRKHFLLNTDLFFYNNGKDRDNAIRKHYPDFIQSLENALKIRQLFLCYQIELLYLNKNEWEFFNRYRTESSTRGPDIISTNNTSADSDIPKWARIDDASLNLFKKWHELTEDERAKYFIVRHFDDILKEIHICYF